MWFILCRAKTVITINAWKTKSPSVRVFAAKMFANTFEPNKDKLSNYFRELRNEKIYGFEVYNSCINALKVLYFFLRDEEYIRIAFASSAHLKF